MTAQKAASLPNRPLVLYRRQPRQPFELVGEVGLIVESTHERQLSPIDASRSPCNRMNMLESKDAAELFGW